MTLRSAKEVLHGSRAVLLDFDGPVCAVFSGLSDFEVSSRLRTVLLDRGIAVDEIGQEHDPLEVLRFAESKHDTELLHAVEDEFRTRELEAVAVAQPTPHALDFMETVHSAGLALAIVSNNSEEAIRAYLGVHRYARTPVIVGRAYAEPHLMKPHPAPVERALAILGVLPAHAVLIGDSTTDIEVSKAAGVASIGFANRPSKELDLREAGADAIVDGGTGMGLLAEALRSHQPDM